MKLQFSERAVLLIVLVIVCIGAAVGYVSSQSDKSPVLYEGIPYDAALLRMDKRALEEAYHGQLLKIFGVWIASGAPADATNLQNGLRIARRAYQQAAQQIARREQELLERSDDNTNR